MTYTFQNLSPADFEDLVRDLIGRELGIRFETFGPGPDDAMDGRHASNGKSTILQAKHYPRSTVSHLKTTMRREKAAIAKLKPRRHILAISRDLSPKNKAELAKIIGRPLRRSGDILSRGDLNGLLRKFPDVEKATIKLWLSSAAMLERIVRAAADTFTAISRAEFEEKVKVYAQNPSFEDARQKLESTHVIIIAGPPGVGKTTLAEMLVYAYLGEEWEFVAIRSLDDGYAKIVDKKKQVFFFNDFLGQVALDTQALAHNDSELARFIKRVRSSPNARFILTTRATIFEEARKVSEHLADQRLDITRYLLDVGIYTRRIKARILYNHLVVANMPVAHIAALLQGDALAKIVDHKNYSPRIVESMTDKLHVADIAPESYATTFIAALDNPHRLWDLAFRALQPSRRHLLYALFFCSQYGVELEELGKAYNALHPVLCAAFGHSHDPKDFEDSVKVLEGGFTRIQGKSVSFVNPSLRDYLSHYFNDISLLSLIASTGQKVDWIEAIWNHVRFKSDRFSSTDQSSLISTFVPLIDKVLTSPVLKRDPRQPIVFTVYDSCVADRIDLLLTWFSGSQDRRFAEAALTLAKRPPGGFSGWRDARQLPELIEHLQTDSFGQIDEKDELVAVLEGAIMDILEGGVSPDDLASITTHVEYHKDYLSPEVTEAVDRAIVRDVESAMEAASEIESESTLEDHKDILRKFGRSVGLSDERVARAVLSIENRIAEIQANRTKAASPEFGRRSAKEDDGFDDTALRNLFAPLVSQR
jgi:DNA polymerase III delta prime subunit